MVTMRVALVRSAYDKGQRDHRPDRANHRQRLPLPIQDYLPCFNDPFHLILPSGELPPNAWRVEELNWIRDAGQLYAIQDSPEGGGSEIR